MRFSERYGFKRVRDVVQIDSIDVRLRNGLWSLLTIHVWNHVNRRYVLRQPPNDLVYALCQRLWVEYFAESVADLEALWQNTLDKLQEYFYSCEWYEAYDFVEFIANNFGRPGFRNDFVSQCNALLEREVSAYRFVDGRIIRITEQEQIDEIEQAIGNAVGPVRAHIRQALALLADRDQPDYRNSIKESISAVEALVAKTVGADKGTLGQLIKKLEEMVALHPALSKAFSQLYGYTSDEGGIRHAMLESDTVKFEDAKFFLVICSAFVNYVDAKLIVTS